MNPIFDNVESFVEANPGSTWWMERLLFRGEAGDKPGGRLKGADVMVGMRYTGPDGEEHSKVTQPLPVGDAPTDVPLVDLLTALHLSQQAGFDQKASECKQLNEAIVTLKAEHKAEVDSLTAKHEVEIAKASRESVALLASVEHFKMLAATAEEQVAPRAQAASAFTVKE